MEIKNLHGWSSAVSLIGAINTSVSVNRFDGNNGALAQVHRLSPQFLVGVADPHFEIMKLRMKVYSNARIFFKSKNLLYLPRALWYKHKAKKLAKQVSKKIRLYREFPDNTVMQ